SLSCRIACTHRPPPQALGRASAPRLSHGFPEASRPNAGQDLRTRTSLSGERLGSLDRQNGSWTSTVLAEERRPAWGSGFPFLQSTTQNARLLRASGDPGSGGGPQGCASGIIREISAS